MAPRRDLRDTVCPLMVIVLDFQQKVRVNGLDLCVSRKDFNFTLTVPLSSMGTDTLLRKPQKQNF